MFWLITQILICLLVAGLLGLFLGWLIWGRRSTPAPDVQTDTAALDTANARIAELDRELANCRAKVAEMPTLSVPAASASAASASVETTAAAGSATAFGLFGPVAETPIDDLKVISGIGPVIEKQLAGIGVVTYRQIADFDADDILRVQEAIDFFPGRIEREDWITQAAALHREKYGNAS